MSRDQEISHRPMFVGTTADSGTRRAEVVERDDGLFEVMVFKRIHEHAPEFGVDEFVWHQVGREKILTDSYERAIELAGWMSSDDPPARDADDSFQHTPPARTQSYRSSRLGG